MIKELAKLFAEYKIYPKSCYNSGTPVRVFQKLFPENHYSNDLEAFLSYQNYEPVKRGADLPWWGKEFFSGKQGLRVMVIAQDSLSKDAGSVVFWVNLMPVVDDDEVLIDYAKRTNLGRFGKEGWKMVKKTFIEWKIDLNFLYVTDAKKVYKEGSWGDRDFDKQKSKELLEAEIKFCRPDLIIILGKNALKLLEKNKKYGEVVESGRTIFIQGVKCAIAPFFIGNGGWQQKRLGIATNLIKNLCRKKFY